MVLGGKHYVMKLFLALSVLVSSNWVEINQERFLFLSFDFKRKVIDHLSYSSIQFRKILKY